MYRVFFIVPPPFQRQNKNQKPTIVLERSARLIQDPDRGDKGVRDDEEDGIPGGGGSCCHTSDLTHLRPFLEEFLGSIFWKIRRNS